jgi:hypothetical protein
MDGKKRIIHEVIRHFIIAEVGNKVTENNMMALEYKIGMVLDGIITLDDNKVKEKDE